MLTPRHTELEVQLLNTQLVFGELENCLVWKKPTYLVSKARREGVGKQCVFALQVS